MSIEHKIFMLSDALSSDFYMKNLPLIEVFGMKAKEAADI